MPHERPPLVTLVAIAASATIYFAYPHERFAADGLALLLIGALALWIFGATVENRLGPTLYAVVFAGGTALLGFEGAVAIVVATYVALYWGETKVVVLSLVPGLATLVEVPAVAVAGAWAAASVVLQITAGS